MKSADFRLLIFIGLTAAQAFGFEATLRVQPPLISLNEQATLSIEVRDARNPQPPSIPNVPGLRIAYTGQSSQMNWVNGRADSFVSFNYRVYPQQTGTYTIGPVEYTIGRETKTLPAASLQVAEAGGSQTAQSWSDLVFARLAIDRHSAYVQEPFVLTLSIYSRQGVQLAGNINLGGMPETGLSELQWEELPASRDVVKSNVFDVRRFQARVRSLGSGTFSFSPTATVQVAIPQNGSRQRRSMFDDPFFNPLFSRVETRPVELPVEPVDIDIKPLPTAGRPADFSGAVGRFLFGVTAKPLDVHPGDPITLEMTIGGDGNTDRILPPQLPAEAPFRLFGDAVREQEDGIVRFEQVVSPKNATVSEIPPIPFSFFDTEKGEYTTLYSDPIPLTVTASSNNTAQVFTSSNSIVMAPTDTPFATESDIQRISSKLKSVWNAIRPWLWIIPVGLIAWLILFAARKIYRIRSKDTARARRQQAPKAARKALKAAAHACRKNDSPAFYNALWNAIADYFGNRLNLPPGEVTAFTAVQKFKTAGMKDELLTELQTLFDTVEAARYGLPQGATGTPEMKNLQQRIEQMFRQCEKMRI